jgi:MFS family permease
VTEPRRATRFRLPAVLREEPQYRILFLGQFLSIIGDRVTQIALPFAVLSLGGSVGDVAAVSVAQFLPFALLALPAGVLGDRWNRKWIVITSDGVRFVVQALAAVSLLTHTATVLELVVIAAIYGAADAFFSPTVTGLIPTIVAPRNIQAANALRGGTYSLGSIAGPLIAGLLLAAVGPGGSFAFDAVTFLVSVGFLLRLHPRVIPVDAAAPAAPTEPFFTQLRAGWTEVRTRPWVLAFLGGMSAYSVFVLPAIFVLGPVLMAQRFDGAPSWALATAGFGVGALIGDLILLRWRPRFAMRVAAFGLIGASCQAIIIGAAPSAWTIAALEVVAGACVTAAFGLWETSIQEHIPGEAVSRVSSFDYLASNGSIPLGNVLAGILSTGFGVPFALFAMGGAGILAAIGVVSVRAVRRLPRGA